MYQGLQLRKSKGSSGFDKELSDALGCNVEILRFPGEGGEAIIGRQGPLGLHVSSWFCHGTIDFPEEPLFNYQVP